MTQEQSNFLLQTGHLETVHAPVADTVTYFAGLDAPVVDTVTYFGGSHRPRALTSIHMLSRIELFKF